MSMSEVVSLVTGHDPALQKPAIILEQFLHISLSGIRRKPCVKKFSDQVVR